MSVLPAALPTTDPEAIERLRQVAADHTLDLSTGKIRRSASRFCLGVEHGDYNGSELFGVGTDRFIWLGYRPNPSGRVRIVSGNYPDEGCIEFQLGAVPEPGSAATRTSWARFPHGVDYILRREGIPLKTGIDAVLIGNIPGGGMSRSASLTLNLILTLLAVNGIDAVDSMRVVDLAQAVENDYIGSPCGRLDQIMILFARAGMGTHYDPGNRSVRYVAMGEAARNLRLVVMDTGTERPGLETSTYKIRRAECEEFVALLRQAGYALDHLAELRDPRVVAEIRDRFHASHPHLCRRMLYIHGAQERFYRMLEAWKEGDTELLGRLFRQDGRELRDVYQISGPELETMCDIARTVPGVLGERMLGGGDKGAAGALVRSEAVDDLAAAVHTAYPRSRPEFHDRYAIHTCRVVEGIKDLGPVL